MTTASAADLVVVGGGISGLAAALSASRQGAKVVLLEASGTLGGKIVTDRSLGIPIEGGPDSFVSRHPASAELVDLLGSEEKVARPGAMRAYVWSAERLHPLVGNLVLGIPADVPAVVSQSVLDVAGKARALADLFTPPGRRIGDVSLAEAVGGRLGRQVLNRLAGPLIGGINAASPNGLSLATVAPQVHEAWKEGGSLILALGRQRLRAPSGANRGAAFLTPTAGMAAIVEAIADELARRDVEVHLASRADGLGRADHGFDISAGGSRFSAAGVVLATPADEAARLLADAAPEAAHHLGRIQSAGVVVTTLLVDEADVARELDGSGFLVARDSPRLLTACTWSTAKWPHLSGQGTVVLRASAGRDGDQRALDLDEEALVRSVRAELTDSGVLRPEAQPRATVVHRWPRAFPQFRPGHLQLVASVDQAASQVAGLGLAGAWRGGIGVPACWASGEAAAKRALGDRPGFSVTEELGNRS